MRKIAAAGIVCAAVVAALALTVLAVTSTAASAAPFGGLRDVAYLPDGNPKHTLDVYLPSTGGRHPLIVFVHGGAFMGGDRRGFAPIGERLAAQGYAVAIPSYRLYPETDAQGATSDIAAAIAWLAHNPPAAVDVTRIVLAGHSAGGQIIAMIATHRRYLDAACAPPGIVRGAFVLAGAYDLRDLSGEPLDWQRIDAGIFGATPADRALISPGLDIDAHGPSIVAACGTHDDPGACPRARFFVKALAAAGIDGRFFASEGADHNELLRRFIDPENWLNRTFASFVAERAGRP